MSEASDMVYTIKQLSNLAGVSTRTLRYYDAIGLLKPAAYGGNGYRQYDEAAVLRLQQILFYRELDFSLDDIQDILDRPEFDVLEALQAHKSALQQQIERLHRLIHTVDLTVLNLQGQLPMNEPQLFEGFSEEKQAQYEQEVRERWGDDPVTEPSFKQWAGYTAAQKKQIMAEGGALYRDLAAAMDQGYASPAVQALIARWHQHLRYFYEPTIDRLRGLGQMYVEHPDFRATFEKLHPDLPEFFRQAITHYCDRL
jgi:MerR family transcriptional regulator, thiopeptide resistance regulator